MKRNIFARLSFLLFFFFGGVCPLCIPKIVAIASFLGLSTVLKDSILVIALLHILTVYILYLSVRSLQRHKNILPLSITVAGTALFAAYYYLHPNVVVLPIWTLYSATLLIAASGLLDYFYMKKLAHCCTLKATSPTTNAT